MSFARSRPTEPRRETLADRRVSQRMRRGTIRSASSRARSASARRRRVVVSGSRSGDACRSRSIAAYTGLGSIDPRWCGQFVLVVAAVAVIDEELVDGRLQRCLTRSLCETVESLVERGRQRRVRGHEPGEQPHALRRLGRIDVAGAADDAIGQTRRNFRPVERPIQESTGRAGQHAEPQQPHHARGQARRVGVEPLQQVVVGAGAPGRASWPTTPAHRRGQRRAGSGRATASSAARSG